jgi:hypothetical protein
MSTIIRRHQNDTKTFEELTTKEQALAINAHTVWSLKAARAHARKIGQHKSNREDCEPTGAHGITGSESHLKATRFGSGSGSTLAIVGGVPQPSL